MKMKRMMDDILGLMMLPFFIIVLIVCAAHAWTIRMFFELTERGDRDEVFKEGDADKVHK